MSGHLVQVGSDHKVRTNDHKVVVAGASDPCCCTVKCKRVWESYYDGCCDGWSTPVQVGATTCVACSASAWAKTDTCTAQMVTCTETCTVVGDCTSPPATPSKPTLTGGSCAGKDLIVVVAGMVVARTCNGCLSADSYVITMSGGNGTYSLDADGADSCTFGPTSAGSVTVTAYVGAGCGGGGTPSVHTLSISAYYVAGGWNVDITATPNLFGGGVFTGGAAGSCVGPLVITNTQLHGCDGVGVGGTATVSL
jgi:hypothetical protein